VELLALSQYRAPGLWQGFVWAQDGFSLGFCGFQMILCGGDCFCWVRAKCRTAAQAARLASATVAAFRCTRTALAQMQPLSLFHMYY
jgi:hypothetical protein